MINYLQNGCEELIKFCDVTYENYINDGAQYVCPDCAYGYYDYEHECKECDLEGCTDCSSEDVCVECEKGKWMRTD